MCLRALIKKYSGLLSTKLGGIVKVLAYGVPILECQRIGVAVVVRKSMREMGLTRNQLFSFNERCHVFVPAKTSDQVTLGVRARC